MAHSNLSALSGRAPHPVFLIAGPTASGKSALALRMAERLGGVIVNADSMQVYRDLAVITARPSREEMARAPHHLFGHIDAVETYSVARWLSDAGGVLAEADRQGHPVIVVGGTGLYFKAALEGLSDIPPVPETVRRAVREAAEGRRRPPSMLAWPRGIRSRRRACGRATGSACCVHSRCWRRRAGHWPRFKRRDSRLCLPGVSFGGFS